jgi:hypothetical protein
VLCNNACVSNVCDSTTGEVFNPASCKCECPVDTELCGGQCLAVCTPPKTQRDPQSCACECPTGTQTCGNTCCAEGELCQNGQCVVSGVCNNPFDPVACVFTTACIGCDVGGVCSLCASNYSSCTTSAEGTTVCVFGGSCSRTCTSTSECGPGEVCAVSCCNGGQDMVCFSTCDNPTAREITLQTESQEPGGPGAAGRGAGGQRALPSP